MPGTLIQEAKQGVRVDVTVLIGGKKGGEKRSQERKREKRNQELSPQLQGGEIKGGGGRSRRKGGDHRKSKS